MKKLSECEEQIMITIWESDVPPALKETMDYVNSKFGHTWKPQTVSTLVHRLCVKQYLNVKRKGRYVYYMPTISREDYRKNKMQEFVNILYNGDSDAAKADIGG